MSSVSERPAGSKTPAETVIEEILDEIAVPDAVLDEAKKRRDMVLEIAGNHPAGRKGFKSGSVAHGTENKPLEDADCGEMIDRRYEEFRAYGPDALGGGKGPRAFVESFRADIEREIHKTYPNAGATAEGKRSIKVEFNEPVDFDEWGEVDPYVDFIVGLSMANGSGIWIPNLETDSWDPGDPMHHTYLMTERDPSEVRICRARVLRLVKRAVKRDAAGDGVAVMCSWNLSALALEYFEQATSLSEGLEGFLTYASEEIARRLTDDPSDAIIKPIKLPEGVSQQQASARLAEMAEIVADANSQQSLVGARAALEELFGEEVKSVRKRKGLDLRNALGTGDAAAVGTAIGSTLPQKDTSSYAAGGS